MSLLYQAGDERVNEQPGLTMMHTLMVREHNDVATRLAKLNPLWDKERVFQETRRIVGAMIQHITFNEFLPMVLGKEVMHAHDLVLLKVTRLSIGIRKECVQGDLFQDGYFDGYDPYTNPSAASGFTSAAFRCKLLCTLPGVESRIGRRSKV